MSIFNSLKSIVPAAMILSTAATTFAATITSAPINISVPTPTTPSYKNSFTFTIPQFDSSKGTLTGVSIAFNVNTNLLIYVFEQAFGDPQNPSIFFPSSPYTFTPNSVNLSLNDPSGTTIGGGNVTSLIGTLTGTSPDHYWTDDSHTSVYKQLIDTVPTTIAGTYTLPTGSLNSLDVPVNFSVSTGGGYSGGGGGFSLDAGSIDGSAIVTYTFTPNAVPEPASLSLLAVGSMLMLRRRRMV